MVSNKSADNDKAPAVRIDKWLWAARFYKTRAIAREMIQGGKVRYNGQRTKPSKTVELNAQIKMQAGFDEKEVVILKISDQRRGAPEAQTLYRETDESIKAREQKALERKLAINHNPHPDTKPDKKQRRQLLNVKQNNI